MIDFKLYPNEEPKFNGVNYLTIIKYHNNFSYSFTFLGHDGKFYPQLGEVVAFSQTEPISIIKALTNG